MFGRWLRRKNPSGPPIALPNLDAEVTAHWKPGGAPHAALPPEAPADSLDFGPAAKHLVGKTRERSRGRRRLLWSLLAGLVVGPIVAAPLIYLLYWVMRERSVETRVLGSPGERITFGPDDQEEIFFSSDISTDEARKLGEALQHEGIFDGRQAKSVRLSRSGDTYVVGFAMEWNGWRDEDLVKDLREMLPRLSRTVFEGRPVEIHLCARQADSKGKLMPTMRVVRAEAARLGKD